MDVVSILRKMRAPLEGLAIEVRAERAKEHPKVFTGIHLRYEATGASLQQSQVEKAVSPAARRRLRTRLR
jgi:putative redox protein